MLAAVLFLGVAATTLTNAKPGWTAEGVSERPSTPDNSNAQTAIPELLRDPVLRTPASGDQGEDFPTRIQAMRLRVSPPTSGPTSQSPSSPLLSRVFRVDMGAFEDSVKSLPPASPAETATGSGRIRALFESIGISFSNGKSTEDPARPSLFFNDRTGMLFVRASPSDLNAIEQLLQVVNVTPTIVDPAGNRVHVDVGSSYDPRVERRFVKP